LVVLGEIRTSLLRKMGEFDKIDNLANQILPNRIEILRLNGYPRKKIYKEAGDISLDLPLAPQIGRSLS